MSYTLFDVKRFKKNVNMLLHVSSKSCSVCIEQIDMGIISFAKLSGIEASWSKNALTLFTPEDATFCIPYSAVIQYTTYTDMINVELMGRHLVSIRRLK